MALASIFILGCASHKTRVIPLGSEPRAINSAMPDRKALDHYLRAISFEDQRFYQGALIEYLQALKYDTASALLRLGAARNYYVLKSPDSAKVQLQKVLAADHGNQEALAFLGEILVSEGEYQRAEQIFRELAEKFPNTVSYHSHLAAIAVTKGQPDEALKEYLTIAQLTGEVVEIMARAGAVFLMRNYNTQALEIYSQLTQIEPDDDKFWYAAGVAHIRLEQPDSAYRCFEAAIDINPREPRYFIALANLSSLEGDFEAAESILRLGIENIPGNPALYNLLGATLQRMQRYDEALEALQQSIELDSTSTAPYVTIGFIYDEMGQSAKAIRAYDTALKIDSTDALVLNNYAYLLAEDNTRLNQARTMSNCALEAEPDNPSYLDTMGWILYRLEEYSQAEDYIRRALETSHNPVIYLHLGEILEAMDKSEQAKTAYRQGLDNNPDNEELKKRLETR